MTSRSGSRGYTCAHTAHLLLKAEHVASTSFILRPKLLRGFRVDRKATSLVSAQDASGPAWIWLFADPFFDLRPVETEAVTFANGVWKARKPPKHSHFLFSQAKLGLDHFGRKQRARLRHVHTTRASTEPVEQAGNRQPIISRSTKLN